MSRGRSTIYCLLLTLVILGIVVWAYVTIPHVTAPDAKESSPFSRVTHIVDGDTIDVEIAGTIERVRFIGIDTPETVKPETPVQCFGPEASARVHDLLDGQSVHLESDPLDDDRDRYDRLLRYVFLRDGSLVNATMVKEGYARAYTTYPFSKKEEFVDLEDQARAQQLGLWNPAACPQ